MLPSERTKSPLPATPTEGRCTHSDCRIPSEIIIAYGSKSFLYAVSSSHDVTFFRQPWKDGKLIGPPQVALKLPFTFAFGYGGNGYGFPETCRLSFMFNPIFSGLRLLQLQIATKSLFRNLRSACGTTYASMNLIANFLSDRQR